MHGQLLQRRKVCRPNRSDWALYPNIASIHTNKKEGDELKSAYRKEKDLQICTNILAAYLVCSEGFGVNKLTAGIRIHPNCMGMLVQRFKIYGLDSPRNTMIFMLPISISKNKPCGKTGFAACTWHLQAHISTRQAVAPTNSSGHPANRIIQKFYTLVPPEQICHLQLFFCSAMPSCAAEDTTKSVQPCWATLF